MDNTERNAEIVRRRKAREWPSSIAKAMGLTRNAVIGVCNRAGLAVAGASAVASREANAKLTPDDIRMIRAIWRQYDRQFGNVALGRLYGVSDKTISQVARNVTWRNVAGRALGRASPTPDDATQSAPARSGGID